MYHLQWIIRNRKLMKFPDFKNSIDKELKFTNTSYHHAMRYFKKQQSECENIVQYQHCEDAVDYLRKCSPCIISENGIITDKKGHPIGFVLDHKLTILTKFYNRVRAEIDRNYFIDYIKLT